jgi:hypothetical protein
MHYFSTLALDRFMKSQQKNPFFALPMLSPLLALIHTLHPFVNYWVDGFHFGIHSKKRMRLNIPDPAGIGAFHLPHFLFPLSFAVAYALFLQRRHDPNPDNAGLCYV